MDREELFKLAFFEARAEAAQEFREELSSMEIALESFFNNVLECCCIKSEDLLNR